MSYIAYMNTPGYLPWADEPAVFDTTAEAWEWLSEQRREQEDSAPVGETDPTAGPYSETVDTLDAWASAGHGPDDLHGPTPGWAIHDLGINYGVTEVSGDDGP